MFKNSKNIDKKPDGKKNQKEDYQALSKEEVKEIKRQRRNERKHKFKITEGKGVSYTPKIGYQFYPSFFRTGNRWGTIIRIVNKYGMNRNMPFGWATGLIPDITEKGVKGYLIETDKPSSKETQSALRQKGINTLNRTEIINDYGNQQTDHDDTIKACRLKDLQEANLLLNSDQQIIDCKIKILLVSDDPDKLVIQLEKLQNSQFNSDGMRGIRLVGTGGDQRKQFMSLMNPPEEGNTEDYTWISSYFGGNDHMVRKGLADKNGVGVGVLVESHTPSNALMDFDTSFSRKSSSNRKGKILVASKPNGSVAISGVGFTSMEASSLWGQRIANNVVCNGQSKVFHIVCNDFKYRYDEGVFLAQPSIDRIIKEYNVAKGGLNPLEMYGDSRQLINIFNGSIDKIVKIFDLLSEDGLDKNERATLAELLKDFYISKDLWMRDADLHPKRVRVLNTYQHDDFPTMGDFVKSITNKTTQLSKSSYSTERERDSINLLSKILRTAVDLHPEIFNRPTHLPTDIEHGYRQFYYHLGELGREKRVLEAQFLNIFDYVASHARPNDVIMIHGMDRISLETISFLEQSLYNLDKGRVRMAYLFDDIGTSAIKRNEKKSKINDRDLNLDLFTSRGILYRNLDDDFDFTILGQMNQDELEMYEHSISRGVNTKLPQNIQDQLTNGGEYRYQIRRPYDSTSSFVNANFII